MAAAYQTPRNQDAAPVLEGFRYQIHVTLLRWLDLSADLALELERGEDIDHVRQDLRRELQVTDAIPETQALLEKLPTGGWLHAKGERLLEQIKCYSRPMTLQSKEMQECLLNFLAHRLKNQDLNLHYQLTTNTSSTKEAMITQHKDIWGQETALPGIELWEQIRQNRDDAQKQKVSLRRLARLLTKPTAPPGYKPSKPPGSDLQQPNPVWTAWQTLLTRPEELLAFVCAFAWHMNELPPQEFRAYLERRLLEDFARTEEEASDFYLYLFSTVLDYLTNPARPPLTHRTLSELLEHLRNGKAKISSAAHHLLGVPQDLELIRQRLDNVWSLQQETYTQVKGFSDLLLDSNLSRSHRQARTTELEDAEYQRLRTLRLQGKSAEEHAQFQKLRDNLYLWPDLEPQLKARYLRHEVLLHLDSAESTRLAAARSALEEAHLLDKAYDDVIYRYALHRADGEDQAALALLENSTHEDAPRFLASYWLEHGEYEQARQALDREGSQPSAEGLRFRALLALLERDNKTLWYSEQALKREPESWMVRFTHALMLYYSALIPTRWPRTPNFMPIAELDRGVLSTLEARTSAQQAAEHFAQLERDTDAGKVERSRLRAWQVAALALYSHTREVALECLLEGLKQQPEDEILLVWMQLLAPEQLSLTSLNALLEAHSPNGALLQVQRLLEDEQFEAAQEQLEEARSWFSTTNPDHDAVYTLWIQRLDLAQGRFDEVRARLPEQYPITTHSQVRLWLEFLEAIPQIPDAPLERAEYLEAASQALSDPEWGFRAAMLRLHSNDPQGVVDRAADLFTAFPTVQTVCLVADAYFRLEAWDELLAVLREHEPIWTGQPTGSSLHVHLENCRLEAMVRLGYLSAACQALEVRLTRTPNARDRFDLIELYLRGADRRRAEFHLLELINDPTLTVELALQAAQLTSWGLGLSKRLLTWALEREIPDAWVGVTLKLAGELDLPGLAALWERVPALAQQPSTGFTLHSIDNLAPMFEAHGTRMRLAVQAYRQGQLPLSLISENHGLPLPIHTAVLEGLKGPLRILNEDVPYQMRAPNRAYFEDPREGEGRTVIGEVWLDLSALVMAWKLGWLELLLRHFALAVSPAHLRSLTASSRTPIASGQGSADLIDLLDTIQTHRIDTLTPIKGKIRLLAMVTSEPSRAVDDESIEDLEDAYLQGLRELLGAKPQGPTVVWSAETFITRHVTLGVLPIVDSVEVANLLLHCGEGSLEQYYRYLQGWRSAGVRFIPLQDTELTHYLSHAQMEHGQVIESGDLGVIRRYYSRVLLEHPSPVERSDPRPLSEVLAGWMDLTFALRRAVYACWRTLQGAQARADWILNHMVVGLDTVSTQLLASVTPEESLRLTVLDLTLWLHAVRDLASEDIQSGYMEWLETRILRPRLEGNPQMRTALIEMLGSYGSMMVGNVSKPEESAESTRVPILREWLSHIESAFPKDLRQLMLKDDSYAGLTGRTRQRWMLLDDQLAIAAETYLATAERVVNEGRSHLIESREGKLARLVLREEHDGRQKLLVIDLQRRIEFELWVNFAPLFHHSDQVRAQFLSGFAMDAFTEDAHALRQELSILENAQDRVIRFEQWRNRTAEFFYGELEAQLHAKRPLQGRPSAWWPTEPDSLHTHYRLRRKEADTLLSIRLERSAEQLLQGMGWSVAFERMATLPTPLPEGIKQAFAGLNRIERRKWLRKQRVLDRSPLAQAHILHLLGPYVEDDAVLKSEARRLADRLATSPRRWQGVRQLAAYLLSHCSGSAEWPLDERIMISWGHASRLFELLEQYRVPSDDLGRWLWEHHQGQARVFFERPLEEHLDAAHPQITNDLRFRWTTLGYAMATFPKSLRGSVPARVRGWLKGSLFLYDPRSYPGLPVLPHPSLATPSGWRSNASGSFLGLPMPEVLETVCIRVARHRAKRRTIKSVIAA